MLTQEEIEYGFTEDGIEYSLDTFEHQMYLINQELDYEDKDYVF